MKFVVLFALLAMIAVAHAVPEGAVDGATGGGPVESATGAVDNATGGVAKPAEDALGGVTGKTADAAGDAAGKPADAAGDAAGDGKKSGVLGGAVVPGIV